MCLHRTMRTRRIWSCIMVMGMSQLLSVDTHARIIYVDASAKGNDTGLDWPNAWPCLQNALAVADSGDSIWVAAGIYRPDQELNIGLNKPVVVASRNRHRSFPFVGGVSYYGGFPQGGGKWEGRNPWKFETILSGDLLGNDEADWAMREDNSRHVGSIAGDGSVVDGFKLVSGNAQRVPFNYDPAGYGGGLAIGGSAKIENCVFYRNWASFGGGAGVVPLLNPFGDADPSGYDIIMRNCIFIENGAGSAGGGFYYHAPDRIDIDHCRFFGNSAATYGGAIGGHYVLRYNIRNCLFICNQANNGGGVNLTHSSKAFTLANCTFMLNTANRGGAVAVDTYHASFLSHNCILWGNKARVEDQIGVAENYSRICKGIDPETGERTSVPCRGYPFHNYHLNIQGGTQALDMEGNIESVDSSTITDLNPYLTPDGHLTAVSPLIDIGSSNGITVDELDLDEDPRIVGEGLDIGSDEFVDTDSDHLPDWWELRYFEDPNAASPQADPDRDGLTNLEEYEQYSSNPTAAPLYVDLLTGPLHTLKHAIDAAQDGDTIIVPAGTYRGQDNRDLDFGGKAIVLLAPAGPSHTVIDCEYAGRAFYFGSSETPATAIIGFTIANGRADRGGAICCEHSHPQFRNCVIRDSHAPNQGPGGIYADLSSLQFHSCQIQNNSPTGMETLDSHLRIIGDLELTANDWHGSNVTLEGEGTVLIDHNTSLYAQDCTIRCNVLGPGTIKVPLENSLIIEKNAVVDLGGETGAHGRILCNGLLKVKDDAAILNADADIRRAKLEDNAIMHNCVINAEAGDPFGQFFVQDKAMIWLDRLISDGDRYLDVDPTEFKGTIDINSINVQITEGTRTSRGGLFELRGRPGLAGDVDCHPENEFLCRAGAIPAFDADSWAIDTLELQAGAKLNLTNRFDFQEPYDIGSNDEVLYVKDLILGPGSILNTSFNQVVYQNLHLDPTAKLVNIPLLGFSLNNISFDDESEFLTRVIHNAMPPGNGDLIQRIVGELPDPNGMMRMTNLTYTRETPTGGKEVVLVNARAKGLFAKSSEDELLVQFEYLFCAPGGELVVYLSDVPELLGHGDPARPDHYIEVARVTHPPAGQPGSMGSDSLGVFTRVVAVQHLNFVKGTRIEFELIGPEGTCLLINNWDPAVRCVTLKCGDVAGNAPLTIDAIDFLAVMSEFGNRISDVNTLTGTGAWCLDSPFSLDGVVTLEDALAIEWAMEGSPLPCYQTGNSSSSRRLNALYAGEEASRLGQAPPEKTKASLWVIGKKLNPQRPTTLVDALYGLDEEGVMVEELSLGDAAHLRSKLICNSNGSPYQLDQERGLLDLSGNAPLIPTGLCEVASEPRYGQPATVHLGRKRTAQNAWQLPMQDIAFDSQGYAYVVPVVVDPGRTENDRYRAAAKLRLDPSQTPPYEVIQLLDAQSLDDNGQYEIELDDNDKVYLLKSYVNNTDKALWIFDQQNGNVENLKTPVDMPTCLHVSGATGWLFMTSSISAPNAVSSLVYAMDRAAPEQTAVIEIEGMGHITGISEDPDTGTLWVLGFSSPALPTQEEIHKGWVLDQDAFFEGRIARIEPGPSGPVKANELTEATLDWFVPVSIVWTGQAKELR
jgi:hypothetical protein